MSARFVLIAMVAGSLSAPAAVKPQEKVPPRCSVDAYFQNGDGSAINIRSGPSASASIVGSLPADTIAVAHLTTQRGGWFEVDSIIDEDSDEPLYKVPVWVHRSQLGLSVAGPYHLRSAPNAKAQKLMKLTPDGNMLDLLDCTGEWVKVRVDGKAVGWMEPAAQCALPMTTCA